MVAGHHNGEVTAIVECSGITLTVEAVGLLRLIVLGSGRKRRCV
jgi:hypothetical protein